MVMAGGLQPHIVAVPYPAQGHVKPLLSLCYKIAMHGIKVTFVNLQFIHAKIIAALSDQEKEGLQRSGISMVSISNGFEENNIDPLSDCVVFTEIIRRVMPVQLRNLIQNINCSSGPLMASSVTCVIADATLGWILEAVDDNNGDQNVGVVEKVAFLPFGPACLALFSCIPKFIQSGIMDSSTGAIPENQHISVSQDIPSWNNKELMWTIPGDKKMQKVFFECCLTAKETSENVKWLLCNTFLDLDSPSCNFIPKIIPIGPLQMSAAATTKKSSGNFWREDSTCLKWLDTQSPASVIYVAFGSTGIFNQNQFNELALGLELSGQPFLWVVRPDSCCNPGGGRVVDYPEGFLERVTNKNTNKGKIVEWAPQERVLGHPSIACFLSHCGWNSTMEGLCFGVPFLCWPYFADQLHNMKYICDVWKVGLEVKPNDDENGGIMIRSRYEIKKKIEELLCNGNVKMNALKFMELAKESVGKGGSSYKNFEKFINHLNNI